MAHGGEAVARLDGKTYFVGGTMPGERVTGEVVRDKGNWARLRLVEIEEPAPDRVTPPCPHFDQCGGCQWQFAGRPSQLEWKRSIVAGQLAHLGGIIDADVRPTVAPGPPYGYRNRMDFRVADGRPALHRPKSRDLVPLTECHLLVPPLRELFDRLGPLEGVRSLTLRAGIRTGDLLVIVSGKVPDHAKSWGSSLAVGTRDGVKPYAGRPAVTEIVAGRPYRISGGAFFQNNTDGADALVALVEEAAEATEADVVLDGYAGGGLFTVALAEDAGRVMAVEVDPTAVRDLRRNLKTAELEATVIRAPFDETPMRADEPWSIAVVDPPRTGLGAEGVAVVTAPYPRRIVYVSCDPASLARDAALLRDEGYVLEWATPVDMFPQTFHIETVARFTLTGDEA
jgi:23S rRNA (uracil1939-C5)-methyltransferase